MASARSISGCNRGHGKDNATFVDRPQGAGAERQAQAGAAAGVKLDEILRCAVDGLLDVARGRGPACFVGSASGLAPTVGQTS